MDVQRKLQRVAALIEGFQKNATCTYRGEVGADGLCIVNGEDPYFAESKFKGWDVDPEDKKRCRLRPGHLVEYQVAGNDQPVKIVKSLGKTASNIKDVEPLLGRTLVRQLSAQIGKRPSLRNGEWVVDGRLSSQLTRKLPPASQGNVYKIGNRFTLVYNMAADAWAIEV